MKTKMAAGVMQSTLTEYGGIQAHMANMAPDGLRTHERR